MPAHLLKHHTDKVQLRPKSTDHNIFAYVINDTEELEFCACLTCDKGALGDGITGNSARWVEMHSKNTSCNKTHPAAFETLKDIIDSRSHTGPQYTITKLDAFIEYFKSNNETPCDIFSYKLYNLYLEWCELMKETSVSLTSFGLEMQKIKAITKSRNSIGRFYTIHKSAPIIHIVTPHPVEKVIAPVVPITTLPPPITEEPPPTLAVATTSAPPTGTGYVYCFVNESMPGLAKIGMTTRTPPERLEEANTSDTWKPPTPYTIAFAKCVTDPKAKERTLHKLLEKYVEKIHKRREFFRISVDDARLFFDLMDGSY